ncbi:MAG: hypothetical protein AAF412_06315 [Pseudomonadota bacterium]
MNHSPAHASSPLAGLASVLSIIIAVFLTPALNAYSSDFIVDAMTDAYGYGAVIFAHWGWMLALGMMVFFLSKALITTLAKLIMSWAYLRLGSYF